MPAHAITLRIPETLYQRFRRRAEWTRRSVETELLDAVAAAAPAEDELPSDFMEAVESLERLNDDELWRQARRSMSQEASEELEMLHFKQRDEGLSQSEDAVRARLMHEYERTMLVRAKAAKLLKDRGHDISGLLATR